ncbi:hypothetical protein [Cupriavidus pauculus]|uniref:hypothetical protein n=1 Tax=Cupriavidus pauculus TaxID=82633 RepID=UPI001D0C65A2|nr:hypothetical protein [Cupriavidus pauculus]
MIDHTARKAGLTTETLYRAVLDCLMNHGMQHTEDTGSGEKYPLVDKLCAPGDDSIKTGKEEVEILAEDIVDAIGPMVLAAHSADARNGEGMAHVAPRPDYMGQTIRHGDRLTHPDGTEFTAIWLNGHEYEVDAWRAVYDDATVSRLGLQISDKGQAVLLATPAAPSRDGVTLQRFAPSNRHEDGMVPHADGDYVLFADVAAPAAPAPKRTHSDRDGTPRYCRRFAPASAAQADELPLAREVRATLNLIANSFHNCKGSAATMQELARDCLQRFDAARQQSATPAEPAVAGFSARQLRTIDCVNSWLKDAELPLYAATVPECTCPSGNGSLRHPCPVHPADAARDPLRAAVQAAVDLMEAREWAEHFAECQAPGDELASRLEACITTLHNEAYGGEDPADAASEADKRDLYPQRLLHESDASLAERVDSWHERRIQRERQQGEVLA